MEQEINLRNIGIIAHVDAGKTTVTEHMLYLSGAVRSLGSVDKGTAHTDWLEIERERGISVHSASVSFPWRNVNINLIDTPGHVDFSAKVERSLRVLDGVVLVISAVEGVQAHTEVLWKALRKKNIPTLLFVNKVDRAGSEVERVLAEIRSMLTSDIVPVQQVGGEGTEEPQIFDLLSEAGDLPGREEILERLAGVDEGLLEKYVSGERVSNQELKEKLRIYTKSGQANPVFFGAAKKGIGIAALMDGVVEFLPAPMGDVQSPVSGVVFKLENDKTMGRIAHVRLYGGTIRNRDTVYNRTQDVIEKVTQIRKVYAQKHEDTGVVYAGDIASVCGLSRARIGDILGSAEAIPPAHSMTLPVLTVQAFSGSEAEYPQLVSDGPENHAGGWGASLYAYPSPGFRSGNSHGPDERAGEYRDDASGAHAAVPDFRSGRGGQ